MKPCLYQKYKKNPQKQKPQNITQAWWQAPVIPATRKAKTEEWVEPGRQKVAVSQEHAAALQPGLQEGNSISKK